MLSEDEAKKRIFQRVSPEFDCFPANLGAEGRSGRRASPTTSGRTFGLSFSKCSRGRLQRKSGLLSGPPRREFSLRRYCPDLGLTPPLLPPRAEYERLKSLWSDNAELQRTDVYTEENHRIEIDCRRTDRTHPMFESTKATNPSDWDESAHPPSNEHVKKMQEILMTYVFAEAGRDYVQGMSDLLSPLYVVAEADEVLAFWCFGTVMERMKGNFLRDQSGMKRQLSELQALIALMDPQLHKHLGQFPPSFPLLYFLFSFFRKPIH